MKTGNLLLISGDHPTYEDGDILCAFNNKRIKQVKAEHICWPRLRGKKLGGMVGEAFPLLKVMLEETRQYKFQRVGDTVERTNLITLAQDIITATPNANGEYMDVEMFIKRRKLFGKLPIFGADGEEFWFGGDTLTEQKDIDKLWKKIEEKSRHKEKDNEKWDFTDAEIKQFTPIEVDDFDDIVRESLTASNDVVEIGKDLKIGKKRNKSVKWRDLVGIDQTKALDKKLKYDARGSVYLLNDIVKVK